MTVKHLTIKAGLWIFCLLTAIAIGFLIVYKTDIKTLQDVKSMDLRFLFFALFFICLSWCFDVLRLKALTESVGINMPFLYGTRVVLSYVFLANITPSSSGGGPLLIYMLNQKGVTVGKASAITFIRGTITLLFFAVGGAIIIYFNDEFLLHTGIKLLFDYTAIFLGATGAFFLGLYFFPTPIRRCLDLLFLYLEKFIWFRGKTFHAKRVLFHIVDDFKSSIKGFIQNERWRLILVAFYTAMMIATQFLVAPMILESLGFRMQIMNTFMIQGVLNFMLYCVPTPGGSGMAEGLGYAFFSPLVPSYIIGLFLILWKLITTYIWTLVGGLIVAKSIGMKHLEEIIITTEKDIESAQDASLSNPQVK
ncbi:MAG: flippase-like domain-containing protein [Candidatus Brocadiaceae bacterium]|nr:flippase-like domain-containing protein [Candidatus Brocadiaceae bacterium]